MAYFNFTNDKKNAAKLEDQIAKQTWVIMEEYRV